MVRARRATWCPRPQRPVTRFCPSENWRPKLCLSDDQSACVPLKEPLEVGRERLGLVDGMSVLLSSIQTSSAFSKESTRRSACSAGISLSSRAHTTSTWPAKVRCCSAQSSNCDLVGTLRRYFSRSRRTDLRHRLIRVRKSIDRLVNAYQDELITIDELRDRTPELRRQEQALHRELQSTVDRAKDRETYLRLAETLTGLRRRTTPLPHEGEPTRCMVSWPASPLRYGAYSMPTRKKSSPSTSCGRCCFPLYLVGAPHDLTGLFRRRISWDDGAIRDTSDRGEGAFLMSDCCRSGRDVVARVALGPQSLPSA